MLVGVLNHSSVQINVSAIQFVNNEIPISEIVPQNIDLTYAVADVFFGIAIAELVICLFILWFYIVYRNNSHIRKSSFPISVAILIGIIIGCIGQITYSLGATDALCIITLYFYRTGLIIVLSGMLVKNYRIYRIFANKTASAINLSEVKLLSIMIAIAAAYLLLLTVVVTVLGFNAELMYNANNVFYQYVECRVPNSTWNTIFTIIMGAISAVIIIFFIAFAWLTRNVSSDYRETKALSAFVVVVTGTYLILVTLIYSFKDSTDSQLFRYILSAELVAIINTCTILFLFFPKIYSIIKQTRKRKHRESARRVSQ